MSERTIAVNGGLIYARKVRQGVWIVSFYPEAEDHPAWPGWITDSTHESIPTTTGLDGVLEWARTEWERREAARVV